MVEGRLLAERGEVLQPVVNPDQENEPEQLEQNRTALGRRRASRRPLRALARLWDYFGCTAEVVLRYLVPQYSHRTSLRDGVRMGRQGRRRRRARGARGARGERGGSVAALTLEPGAYRRDPAGCRNRDSASGPCLQGLEDIHDVHMHGHVLEPGVAGLAEDGDGAPVHGYHPVAAPLELMADSQFMAGRDNARYEPA